MSTKTTAILYWSLTGLFAAVMLLSGIMAPLPFLAVLLASYFLWKKRLAQWPTASTMA